MSDLAELFATDPLKLTSADFVAEWEKKTGMRPLDMIIKRYRDARAAFDLGEKSAGSSKKMKADKDAPKLDAKGLDEILKGL